jgi:hypothetical protein
VLGYCVSFSKNYWSNGQFWCRLFSLHKSFCGHIQAKAGDSHVEWGVAERREAWGKAAAPQG